MSVVDLTWWVLILASNALALWCLLCIEVPKTKRALGIKDKNE